MTEKQDVPVTWQPSEIIVKDPARNNEYFGNCVSWAKKSRMDVLGEILEGCGEHLQNVIDAGRRWTDIIDAQEVKYKNLIDCVNEAIYGNGLDPDDDGYLPGLMDVITDALGD